MLTAMYLGILIPEKEARMQATANQLKDAIMIHKKLGVSLPRKMTVDAYGKWLRAYTPMYVKEKSIGDIRDLIKGINP